MLLYPSVDKLLEKVDSRYKLIALGAKRARELDAGLPATQETFESNKSVGQALEEVENGAVIIDPKFEDEV
ncbi:DNA-directed RNA polymerase subunit omega [Leuconostoc mesenteroides]|uniref:DNA-directed RNA polymerase subunit omega n=1 Tax=Leuconostoc mesenteroides TaxID=1245 RepID=UPI002245E97F|nr:DNA-directed RNA polymerase subunit omega [Leuconostoc mesenteroides]MCX2666996.1 DNA-directed RNA polymerase subunit omega [Leuconostoc mesenteroides subsp. mesenteroides]